MKNFALRLFTVVFLTFIFQACNEPLEQFQDSSPFSITPPGIEIAMEKVKEVVNLQEKVSDALFRNPLVVGHGVGYNENGKLAIIVYTMEAVKQRKEVNTGNIGKGDYPLALPFEIENIPLAPKVTGMFKSYADPTAWFPRPVPIGVSVGHPDITAGTIGCRVTDGKNVYILSNNHVLANSNKASVGDNILQPGPYDGGTEPDDVIGTLFDFEPISFSSDNLMDAAIALVTSSDLSISTPVDGYLTPSSTTVAPAIGMGVKKYGRTTGYTHGTIDALYAVIDVCYQTKGPIRCVQSARFVNQIIITPGTFSAGGDSGSLIVTDDNNPVALLFAGSNTNTIGSPIDVILDNFGVTVDDGKIVVPPSDITDIAVSNISAVPSTATIGDIITVNVIVSNIGDKDVTGDIVVNLTDNSSLLNSWTIEGGLTTGSSKVVTYSWETQSSSTGNHTIAATSEYSDDNDGNDSNSTDVELTDGSTPNISLTATEYKVRGVRWVNLVWEGTDLNTIDITILKDGNEFVPVGETINDNNTADIELGKVSGIFTFVVCESGSENCSNEATIVF